jgi:hypothetical protein
MSTKPRADSKLKTLPDDTQAELARRAAEPGQTWSSIRAWLRAEHGVDLRSDSSLSAWLPWYQSRMRAREREAKIQALLDHERALNPTLTDPQLFSMGQRFFSELAIADEDAKAWAAVRKVGLDADNLDLARTRFARETCELFIKYCADRQAMEIANSAMGNEEKIAALGPVLFGDTWQKLKALA